METEESFTVICNKCGNTITIRKGEDIGTLIYNAGYGDKNGIQCLNPECYNDIWEGEG